MFKGTWKLENDIACFERKDTRPRRYSLYELLTEMGEHLAYGKNGVTNLELFEAEAIHIAQGISLFAKNNPHTADTRVEQQPVEVKSAEIDTGGEKPCVYSDKQISTEITNKTSLIQVLQQRLIQIIRDNDTYEELEFRLVANYIEEIRLFVEKLPDRAMCDAGQVNEDHTLREILEESLETCNHILEKLRSMRTVK